MNSVKYWIIYTDTFRWGPQLYVESFDDMNEEKLFSDEQNFVVDVEITSKYNVYHTLLGDGYDKNDVELICIASFQSKEEARQYAKEQYYLYTGKYPFIVDGYVGSGYKSTGSRKCIEIDLNASCKLVKPKNNMIEYLIISNGLDVEAHSLNPFAEW